MKKIIRKFFWIPLIFIAILIIAIIFYNFSHVELKQSAAIKAHYSKDSTFIRDDLTDLPLLKFGNDTTGKDYFVILFSGDGGWRGFINTCATTISEKGVSVVGFNVLPYFDSVRSPQKIASDITRIVNNFGHVWNKKYFIIGGYSFSAEILPFVYNAFSDQMKQRTKKVFMIAPSTLADFKASRNYRYDESKSLPVIKEFIKTDQKKYIIFCDDQDGSLCGILPSDSPAKVVDLKSGHLFIGKTKEVSEIIANEIIQ